MVFLAYQYNNEQLSLSMHKLNTSQSFFRRCRQNYPDRQSTRYTILHIWKYILEAHGYFDGTSTHWRKRVRFLSQMWMRFVRVGVILIRSNNAKEWTNRSTRFVILSKRMVNRLDTKPFFLSEFLENFRFYLSVSLLITFIYTSFILTSKYTSSQTG